MFIVTRHIGRYAGMRVSHFDASTCDRVHIRLIKISVDRLSLDRLNSGPVWRNPGPKSANDKLPRSGVRMYFITHAWNKLSPLKHLFASDTNELIGPRFA